MPDDLDRDAVASPCRPSRSLLVSVLQMSGRSLVGARGRRRHVTVAPRRPGVPASAARARARESFAVLVHALVTRRVAQFRRERPRSLSGSFASRRLPVGPLSVSPPGLGFDPAAQGALNGRGPPQRESPVSYSRFAALAGCCWSWSAPIVMGGALVPRARRPASRCAAPAAAITSARRCEGSRGTLRSPGADAWSWARLPGSRCATARPLGLPAVRSRRRGEIGGSSSRSPSSCLVPQESSAPRGSPTPRMPATAPRRDVDSVLRLRRAVDTSDGWPGGFVLTGPRCVLIAFDIKGLDPRQRKSSSARHG